MKKHSVRVAALVAVMMSGAVLLGADAAPRPSTAVSVGGSFIVEPPMARYVGELDPRELNEQVRDWAVLATVTRLGATPEEAAAATYELPPARLPYLDELYAFEYGRGRRVYLGGRVLLFRDADDPDPQATIGRLADRVREESGAIPAKVEIYLVHDQRDEGTIRIERAPDVTGKALFSPAYGYVEGKADSAAELAAWLARADDLSFAQLRDGHLVVGGRRFVKTRTANLTAEDVAALYQAHEQLGPPLAARQTIRALPKEAQQTIARARELVIAGRRDEALAAWRTLGDQVRVTSRAEADAIIEAVRAISAPVGGPGFSLDPEWLPDPVNKGEPMMLTRMRRLVAQPCAELRDIAKRGDALERAEPDPTRRTSVARRALAIRDLVRSLASSHHEADACRALGAFVPELKDTITEISISSAISDGRSRWESALARYHELDARLNAIDTRDVRGYVAALTREVLRYYAADTQAQCARYEGTAGTGVGMTMFYTDLLAKLWMSTDYGLSAPITQVAGFVAKPQLELPPALAESSEKNSSTRIWFGPRGGNVSRVDGAGTSLLFEHSFARIFAAGNDPTQPGVEVRPNEASRRAIGWWDRHYDDAADYEQEYHRLNQIMKWSLVTGALFETNVAQYLSAVSVRRDHDFDRWYHANQPRLRFSGSIPLASRTLPGKECLPIFESYEYQTGGQWWSISGGVGAATRDSLPRVSRVDTARPLGARKPPAPNLVGDTAGTAVRVAPRLEGKQVVFDHVEGIPMRDARGNVSLGSPRVTFTSGARPGALGIDVGTPGRQIGVATAQRNGSSIKMGWQDGPVEAARHGAPRAARDIADADGLASSGNVQSAAPLYEAVSARGPPQTALERARNAVIDAAYRRPGPVLRMVDELATSGEALSPGARQLLVGATRPVATPGAAGHIELALEHGLPLNNRFGGVDVERGKIIATRDIDTIPTTTARVPEATDLSTRHVYIDRGLRVGQEGLIPDTGGPAARWQRRVDVRMEELRQHPMGPLPDRLIETSTGSKFDYIPPTHATPQSKQLPPILIRYHRHRDDRCDGRNPPADCPQRR